MKEFADLHHLSENERIAWIARRAIDEAKKGDATLCYFVDDDEKADRYIAKMAKRFPEVRVVARGKKFLASGISAIKIDITAKKLN